MTIRYRIATPYRNVEVRDAGLAEHWSRRGAWVTAEVLA